MHGFINNDSGTSPIRTFSFDNAFDSYGNGDKIGGLGEIKDERERVHVSQKYGNSGVIAKIVSLPDKLIMIPRAGDPKYANRTNAQQDIWVATYDGSNKPSGKFYTFINTESKVNEILLPDNYATTSGRHYVADAVAAGNNKVAILTGRKTTDITNKMASGTSLVAVLDLADAPTDLSGFNAEAGFAGAVDRSSKVTIASATTAKGNAFSHIAATDEKIRTTKGAEIELNAIAYEGTDAATPHEATEAHTVQYEIVSGNADVFDLDAGADGGKVYIWDTAPEGVHTLSVLASLKEEPMIKSLINYEVSVPYPLTVTVNEAVYGMSGGSYASAGLVEGENKITVNCEKELGTASYNVLIAVYGGDDLLVAYAVSPENNPGTAECVFNIPEGAVKNYKFKTFIWNMTNISPL